MNTETEANVPAFICKTTTNKAAKYINNLNALENKHVSDFALHTPVNAIQRFLVRYELMKLIVDIPGAVMEMGVCSGNGLMSLIHCHNVLQPTYQYREFYGFDTFEGFPEVHTNDIADVKWEKGDFANHSYDRLHEVLNIHNSFFYTPTRVELIKGDVRDTVPEFINDNKHIIIALLYLDLDLYLPTKICLKKLLPRMAKGSVIAFDELNWKSFPGETLAALEEIGTKYKFKNLLNSHINYCIIE